MNEIFEAYRSLNNMYAALKFGGQPTAEKCESLVAGLLVLRDLNDAIGRIEAGPFDVLNRRELALQQRAAAWLAGWASFSRLAVHFSRQGAGGDFRERLIRPSEHSAFGLLLTIYRQMTEADAGVPEPLRHHLRDRTNVAGLSYTEKIVLADGSRDWYIPSSAEIVGESDDDPGGARDILSLWALVNLQLDTWHSSAPEYTPHGCMLRKASGGDGSPGLAPLADWLESVNDDKHLAPLVQAGGFKTPAGKIVRFLRFRQRYASGRELAALCEEVRTERLKPDPRLPESLKPLAEAATPDENGGQLYDASIWLRYVVLLSFDRERSVITDAGSPNGLEKTWERFRPGEPYVPVVGSAAARGLSSCAPLLRWNAAPYGGSASAVIADLVAATYRYLGVERAIRSLEGDRFQTVSRVNLSTSGKSYAKKLNEHLARLREVFEGTVGPYFSPPQVAGDAGVYRPSDWADPSEITRPDSKLGITFHSSCTPSERARFAGDLSVVAREIKATEARYDLIRQAYERVSVPDVDLREVSAVLEPLGGLTALSNWNLYRLPSKSFDDYLGEFKVAVKRLADGVDAQLLREQLAATFRIKRGEVEADYLTMLAARLGRDVAERAVGIARTYQRISELDVQIEELGAKLARLDSDAWKNESEKAGARLAYATRMRDLVSARVEALGKASEEAADLAGSAGRELGAMAEQLRAAALAIEDNKSKSALFGIIKLVVNVVGAALAPFTGGASIAVATLVNKGVDIYQQASSMKWDSFGQTIANLEKLGPALADGINFAVDKFGSPELKAEFAKVSAFVKSTREKLQQTAGDLKKHIEDLGLELRDDITVGAVIKAVQDLEPDKVLNFAAAIANGYTMNVAGTQVRVDFRGKKVTFRNDGLRQGLLDLYAAGHVVINDAAARAEGLTSLAALPDEELRRKLYESFRGAVGQLPPEFLERLKLKADESKKRAEQTLERLKESIAKELGADDLRLFAQVLAAGCLFVKDGEAVVAVEPPPLTDADKLRQRAGRYKERVEAQVIKEFIGYWNDKKKELTAKAQQLSAGQDESGMRDFADSLSDEITARPGGIQDKLEEIKTKIEEARDELEDKVTEVEIADYEAKADALFAKAAEARVQQADLRDSQARLRLEAALEIYLNTLTEEERASALVRAEMRRVESGELALVQAYEKCLALGFNPLSVTAEPDGYGEVSFRRPLSSFADLGAQLGPRDAGNAADSLVGMIQWANLLGVRPADAKKSPAGLYFRLVEALTVDGRPGGGMSLADELNDIQAGVDEGLTALKLGPELAQVGETGAITFDQIQWLDRPELTDQQRDALAPLMRAEREALLSRVADVYKERVIGVLPFVVYSVDAPEEDAGGVNIPRPVKNTMYYADIDWVSPIAKWGQGLSFIILPPEYPRSYPGVLTVGGAAVEDPDDIPLSWDSKVFENQYRDRLKSIIRTLRLTGALGRWAVLILATASLPAQRLAVARKLKSQPFQIDNLPMIFIQVPAPK